MPFDHRLDAGIRLARMLERYRTERPVVLALPRGGIEVAHPIAEALGAPLDVLCVRKVGAPGQPEVGLGAVSEGGAVYIDRTMLARFGVEEVDIRDRVARKKKEVEARVQLFRHGRARIPVEGRTVIVVDDGVATGGTMKAALLALRLENPDRVVLAVPVAPPSSLRRLALLVDDVVVLETHEDLVSVGTWYADFRPVPNERVVELLESRRASLEQHAG